MITSPEAYAALVARVKVGKSPAPAKPQPTMNHVPTAAEVLALQLTARQIGFIREFRFHPRRKWRADFLIVPLVKKLPRLIVEVEGGTWKPKSRHTTGKGFEDDCEKYAAAMLEGYTVLRVTTRQIENDDAISWITQLVEGGHDEK